MGLRLALLGALFAAPVFAGTVYECKDGQRYLRVHLRQDGKLAGTLKYYRTGPTQSGTGILRLRCEHSGRGASYTCKGNGYEVRAARGASGRRMVWVSLEGDFGPTDSGYLYSLYCE